MRIVLRLLEFLDRLADFAYLKIQHAQFKADGEVGGKFLHALATFIELHRLLLRREISLPGRVIIRRRVELRHFVIHEPRAGVGDGLVERGVAPGVGGFEAVILFQRVGETFLLRVKFRERPGQLDVARVRPGETRLIFADQPLHNIFGFHHALILFELRGLDLVLEHVAIGTALLVGLVVTALVQGAARGKIFQRLAYLLINRQRPLQFNQRPFRLRHFADVRQRVAELDDDGLVARVVAGQHFKRKHGGARQFERERGLGGELVPARVVRVAAQNLLGDEEGLGGIIAQREIPLGDLRGVAGAAPHLFEQTAARARLADLRVAQRPAAIHAAGPALEHLHEEINGVIKVVALQRLHALGVKLAQFPRQSGQFDFSHGNN